MADLEDTAFDSDREEPDADDAAAEPGGGDGVCPDDDDEDEMDRLTLDRFKLALKYEQKQV